MPISQRSLAGHLDARALERQEGLRKQALFAHSELSGLDHCVGWESRNSYNERTKISSSAATSAIPAGIATWDGGNQLRGH